MNPERLPAILRELLGENPFALRPFLKLAELRLTGEVPTMAVTCEANPALLVNPGFVERHCPDEAAVKAVLIHELLHVLLRHTSGGGPSFPAEHLAMDAVINAIIHRQLGSEYSGMMSGYYARAEGLERLLRPPREGELPPPGRSHGPVEAAWRGLYEGRLVADDIAGLAATLSAGQRPWNGVDILLGSHGAGGAEIGEAARESLDRVLRALNGGGLWRSPPACVGIGIDRRVLTLGAGEAALRIWEAAALRVLTRHLLPRPPSAARRPVPAPLVLPLPTPRDRRAFARSLWSPILPFGEWETVTPAPAGAAQVYLDVSGSMEEEMPLLVSLLNRLRAWIRLPFWAFSDTVEPARILGGRLETSTSGGTDLGAVLAHIARTRPAAAVIVTDGYVGRTGDGLVEATAPSRLHAIVSRHGSTRELERLRIPHTRLPEVPS